MSLVDIGDVTQFPPNIFFSENKPNIGALVWGRDNAQPGPPDKGNRWYRVVFAPGASWNDLGTSRVTVAEGGAIGDPSNGNTLGGWLPVTARPTRWVLTNLPALAGNKASGGLVEAATLDASGRVFIDESLAMAATGNGKYGSYLPMTGGVGVSNLPPGLGGPSAGGHLVGRKIVEFSVGADGNSWWTAKDPHESASTSGKNGRFNPHPGVSVINPDDVAKLFPLSAGTPIAPGQTGPAMAPPLSVIDLQDYLDAGWEIPSTYFVAYQADSNTAVPATDELQQAMDAALNDGDEASQKALTGVGIKPPKGTGVKGAFSGIEDLILGKSSY